MLVSILKQKALGSKGCTDPKFILSLGKPFLVFFITYDQVAIALRNKKLIM